MGVRKKEARDGVNNNDIIAKIDEVGDAVAKVNPALKTVVPCGQGPGPPPPAPQRVDPRHGAKRDRAEPDATGKKNENKKGRAGKRGQEKHAGNNKFKAPSKTLSEILGEAARPALPDVPPVPPERPVAPLPADIGTM